jgi:hypothetical protein
MILSKGVNGTHAQGPTPTTFVRLFVSQVRDHGYPTWYRYFFLHSSESRAITHAKEYTPTYSGRCRDCTTFYEGTTGTQILLVRITHASKIFKQSVNTKTPSPSTLVSCLFTLLNPRLLRHLAEAERAQLLQQIFDHGVAKRRNNQR